MSNETKTAELPVSEKYAFVDQATLQGDEVVRKNIGYWADAARRFYKNKVAMFFLVVLVAMIIMSIVGPMISNKDYITIAGKAKNLSPNSTYWFGTDSMGRDLFSRAWVGLRASLLVAAVASVVQLVIGCLYGAIMATVGGIVDEIMMRIVEVLSCLPNLILFTLLLVVFGN